MAAVEQIEQSPPVAAEMEHKTLPLERVEVKAEGGKFNAGQIRGYAATFGNVDRQGDRIIKGAFQKSLPAFMRDGFIALSHDPYGLPIAMPSEAKEDDYGLFLVADYHSTPEAQNARTVAQERIAAGKSVAFSIGYMIPDGGSKYQKDGVRELLELGLHEVSQVNLPANPMALVTGVKDVSLADEVPFSDHLQTVADAVEDVARRIKARVELRHKAGRTLSAASRQRIRDLIDRWDTIKAELTQWLDEVDAPPSQEADAVSEDAIESKAQEAPVEQEQESEPEEEQGAKDLKTKEPKGEAKRPGEAGTAGWYRLRLSDFEHFCVQNGVTLKDPNAAQGEREGTNKPNGDSSSAQ